jgi:shikimate 5-dehydrogenase
MAWRHIPFEELRKIKYLQIGKRYRGCVITQPIKREVAELLKARSRRG